MTKYTITFACHNQIDFTRQCIESMHQSGIPLDRIVVVDNYSTDGTITYLQGLPLGRLILNSDNLGCGVAWNQGALEFQSDWTVIMNNDVIVSSQWLEGLINAAIKHKLEIISPAMIEGELNYDFQSLALKARMEMFDVVRFGWTHAVCMAIHKRVWKEVGYFRATPKLFGFEDTIFFHEVQRAGIRMGTTGASWIHHFGSVTQSAIKRDLGLKVNDELSDRYNHHLLNQSWLDRKLKKIKLNLKLRNWQTQEVNQYGRSLWGRSTNNMIAWS